MIAVADGRHTSGERPDVPSKDGTPHRGLLDGGHHRLHEAQWKPRQGALGKAQQLVARPVAGDETPIGVPRLTQRHAMVAMVERLPQQVPEVRAEEEGRTNALAGEPQALAGRVADEK